MRRLFVPAASLLLLFSYATVPGQERDLQLTASIKAQQSCSVSASVDSLRLTLQLRYTNTGHQKLILYKGNRLFFQIFVSSRGEKDVAAGRSELRTTHSRFFDEQPEKIVSPNPGTVFTILSPGESYETTQIISLPVARDGAGVFNVSIAAGEHVLNVAASTWYESKKLGDELRERWRSRGLLWTDPVVSNSVTFAVGRERSTAACQ
jgi:hypothetical protein